MLSAIKRAPSVSSVYSASGSGAGGSGAGVGGSYVATDSRSYTDGSVGVGSSAGSSGVVEKSSTGAAPSDGGGVPKDGRGSGSGSGSGSNCGLGDTASLTSTR